MKKFTKKIQGSISLFLSMIILLLVILEGFLIDGSKVLAAKSLMASAGDLSMNAALTYYDEALKDIYGLFAISKTEEELKDNLETYFKKTIGESAGDVDGNYVDGLLDYIETSLATGIDEGEMGQLLQMNLNSFSVAKIPEAALSEPYVMKQEILQYMKYRGPVSLGYGILEKLQVFQELDKQQQAMERKLDYEEEMSEVQKACQAAYDQIKPYNELLDGLMSPESVEAMSLRINQNVKEATIGVFGYSAACRDFQLNENWERKTTYRGTDVRGRADACADLDDLARLRQEAEADLHGSDFNGHIRGTMKAVKTVLGYRSEFDKYGDLYTAWENYKVDYEEQRQALLEALSEAEDEEDEEDDGSEVSGILDELAELDKEYDDNEEIFEHARQQIDTLPGIIALARQTLSDDSYSRMIEALAETKNMIEAAQELKGYAHEGKGRLTDVISSMENLKTLGKNWSEAVGRLSDGDVKTSMTSDYENKAKELDPETIQALWQKLERGEAYADEVLTGAKNAKALGGLLGEGSVFDISPDSLRQAFEASPYGNDTIIDPNGYVTFEVDSWTENAQKTAALSDESETVYVRDSSGGTLSGEFTRMDLGRFRDAMEEISGKTDEFYLYLERVCAASKEESDEKKAAKEKRKKLLELGKNEETAVSGLPTLPGNATGATGGGDDPKFTQTGSEEEDNKVSENSKKNTKSSASFLERVGELLKDGRDKLYISEYAMEMFSCYTTPKMQAGDQVTLSNYPINAENNYMFQAEAEYVLWGNEDGSKDVSNTMAAIFGIRFLLNSIYAFTGDPEIRQESLAMAVAIAGWTGFGVPLVQSVIILGFALAETAVDMSLLKNGKSVPVYKSVSTWMVKASQVGELGEMAASQIGERMSAGKQYLFDEMNALTEETKAGFSEKVRGYGQSAVNDVAAAACSAVLAPVQERIIGLVNVVSASPESLNQQIGEALESVETMIALEEDSVQKEAKKEAVRLFRSQYQQTMADVTKSVQNSNLSKEQITERMNGAFESIKNDLTSRLQEFVEPRINALCGKVNEALDHGNGELQSRVSDAVDEMMAEIDGGGSKSSSTSKAPDGGNGRTSTSAALSMNYKEYVSVFIAVKCIANEDDVLKRIGNLIQANLAESQARPSENFKIGEAGSMVEIRASADLKTTFFAIPIPLSGGGTDAKGQDHYAVSYRGILGY